MQLHITNHDDKHTGYILQPHLKSEVHKVRNYWSLKLLNETSIIGKLFSILSKQT